MIHRVTFEYKYLFLIKIFYLDNLLLYVSYVAKNLATLMRMVAHGYGNLDIGVTLGRGSFNDSRPARYGTQP